MTLRFNPIVFVKKVDVQSYLRFYSDYSNFFEV